MMATRVMSASSASSARRHNIRRERSQVVVDARLQRKAAKEMRKAENAGQEKVKISPSLCYLLVRKLAPKALIIVGGICIFFGIMLICMGYDAKLHYPEARGWGISLFVLGVIAVPLGIVWRCWRLKHRREKKQPADKNTEPEVSFSTQSVSVSMADITIDNKPTNFDNIAPPQEVAVIKKKNKKMAPKNPLPPIVPQIEVSYIETDNHTKTTTIDDLP